MKNNNAKYSVFSIMPIILLFGFFFSNIGIRLPLLISLGLILLIGYFLILLKIHKNNILFLFLIFFLWTTFLLIRGDSQIKYDIYSNLIAAAFMMVGIYYYSLYSNISHFIICICFFIVVSFITAFFEVNFNLILPSSGKNEIAYYAINFRNIPTSTFFNPNDFAVAIGMVFIYTYSYLKIMNRKIRYLILLCSLYIIYFTGSRGVQLTIILFPIIYSILNKGSIKKLLAFYILMLIIGLVFVSFSVLNSYNTAKYLAMVNAIKGGQILDWSTLQRWNQIVYTLGNLNKLIVGFGPGGTLIFLDRFPIANPHNFFIEIIIDYGFLGITLVISIFFISLRTNYQLLMKNISYKLRASCKATIILTYLFIIFSAISSSLLVNWPFAWLPVYLTLINIGAYKQIMQRNV